MTSMLKSLLPLSGATGHQVHHHYHGTGYRLWLGSAAAAWSCGCRSHLHFYCNYTRIKQEQQLTKGDLLTAGKENCPCYLAVESNEGYQCSLWKRCSGVTALFWRWLSQLVVEKFVCDTSKYIDRYIDF